MQTWSFYSKHLEKVSRSFSFCIAQLPTPKREWVALAYLLFRIADTIEDSDWDTPIKQLEAFTYFSNALLEKQQVALPKHWCDLFPKSIHQGEKQLLLDAPLLINDLFLLPTPIKKQIQANLCQMMLGMKHFLQHHLSEGKLTINELAELNQYCFFVAGIVGELLTFIFSDALMHNNQDCLIQGFHFGLFLQKINILKDQLEDESLGKQFISSRSQLKASVINHAKHAFTYICSISADKAREYKLFCAWSLFIGLASLKWIDKHFTSGKRHKISYMETMSIIYKLNNIVDDEVALTTLFGSYLSEINIDHIEQNNQDRKSELPTWFVEIYPSAILTAHAADLGLI